MRPITIYDGFFVFASDGRVCYVQLNPIILMMTDCLSVSAEWSTRRMILSLTVLIC